MQRKQRVSHRYVYIQYILTLQSFSFNRLSVVLITGQPFPLLYSSSRRALSLCCFHSFFYRLRLKLQGRNKWLCWHTDRLSVNIARGDLGMRRSAASSPSTASCFEGFPSKKPTTVLLGKKNFALSHSGVRNILLHCIRMAFTFELIDGWSKFSPRSFSFFFLHFVESENVVPQEMTTRTHTARLVDASRWTDIWYLSVCEHQQSTAKSGLHSQSKFLWITCESMTFVWSHCFASKWGRVDLNPSQMKKPQPK